MHLLAEDVVLRSVMMTTVSCGLISITDLRCCCYGPLFEGP
nr:hypothetical protein JVH1_6712 [Rhodococcus sp. JVH1]